MIGITNEQMRKMIYVKMSKNYVETKEVASLG